MLLLRRTGALIASWSRNGAAADVVSVMAATLYGSIETMVGALGSPAPSSVFLETDLRRMLLSRVGSQNVLLLVAARSVRRSVLRRELQRLSSTLSAAEPPEVRESETDREISGAIVVREPSHRTHH